MIDDNLVLIFLKKLTLVNVVDHIVLNLIVEIDSLKLFLSYQLRLQLHMDHVEDK